MALPVHFLALQPGRTAATVNQTGDWGTILGLEDIHVSPQQDGSNDIVITDDKFWNLTFSSAGNLAVFKKPLSVNRVHSDANMGDDFDSGVLVLSSSKSDPIPLQGDQSICAAFGIKDSSMSQTLWAFLKAVDSTGILKATVHKPSTPTPRANALWCVTTDETYKVAATLTFDLAAESDDPKGPLGSSLSWVNDNLGVSISLSDITKRIPKIPDILVTLTKTTFYPLGTLVPSETYSLSSQFSILGFDCSVDFTVNDMSVILNPRDQPAGSFFSFIQDAVGSPQGLEGQLPTGDSSDMFSQFFSHIHLWYITLKKDTSSSALSWGIALLANWTIGGSSSTAGTAGASGTPILVGMGYDSADSIFYGRLILAGDVPGALGQRLPEYDPRVDLPHDTLVSQGIDPDNLPTGIDLWDLLPDHGTVAPKNIPHVVKAARVSYQTLAAENQSTFQFFMEITDSNPPQGQIGEAPSGFVWDKISIEASVTKSSSGGHARTATSIRIFSSMALFAKNNPRISPALLNVTLGYQSSGTGVPSEWNLHGSLRNVSVALLADYFDESCRDGAMAVLGNINLSSLEMFYAYTSGSASSFLITAVLRLGALELDLSYQYVSVLHQGGKTAAVQKWGDNRPKEAAVVDPPASSTQWAFEAFLRTNSPNATIASIAESISPGAGSKLPGFVGGITITPKGDPDNSPVKLRYSGDNTNGSALTVWVSIGSFNLTFVQFRARAKDGKSTAVKRILRISVDQIPIPDNIPLVGQIPQPFDHLVYLWVEDDDPSHIDPTEKGFTRAMVQGPGGTDVNTELKKMHIPPIQLRESKTPKINDLVLQAGHHFIIISNGKVVLDHVFQNAKQDGSSGSRPTTRVVDPGRVVPTGAAGHVVPAAAAPSQDAVGADEAAVTKGATDSKAGPLSISGLSLQYKDGSLFVGLDATLVLGPLTFSVIGFTLEIALSQGNVKLDSLADIVKKKLIQASIHGLEAGLSKPPLTLNGVFVHETVDVAGGSVDIFKGGISVGFKAWDLLAVGEYKVTTLENHTFKSVFVYGKLDGPLVTVEFATISGVRVGFGFNSAVYLPTANKLYTFPFINDNSVAGAGNDPMKVLAQMVDPRDGNPAYVHTKEGGCWFCAVSK
ncbi:hypothetical protein GP486_002980 [Trichoglossum hirsutum]|uniref:DUF6603 domain-containing protein n=1 Tax=Trichoglossum hirsutum TaxID=265104 RepID=A0A9P8LDX9_9PEZI|nr:hypothetical protein GP486_002980 [Trichoglossum hirsutum]